MLKPESNQAVENFFSAVDTEFNQFLHDRKPEDYQAAAQLILESQAQGGRIHVTGIGKCSHVATYVASLLSSTGNPAYYLHGTEAVTAPAASWWPGMWSSPFPTPAKPES